MLIIRLQRTGTKNKPAFRIVLAEAHRAAGKKFLEVLGSYNPKSKNFIVKNQERLDYWISKKVAMSPTVNNLLVEKKLFSGSKVKAWKPKKKESPATTQPAPTAITVEEKKTEETGATAGALT